MAAAKLQSEQSCLLETPPSTEAPNERVSLSGLATHKLGSLKWLTSRDLNTYYTTWSLYYIHYFIKTGTCPGHILCDLPRQHQKAFTARSARLQGFVLIEDFVSSDSIVYFGNGRKLSDRGSFDRTRFILEEHDAVMITGTTKVGTKTGSSSKDASWNSLHEHETKKEILLVVSYMITY